MPVFQVSRHLPGANQEALGQAQQAAIAESPNHGSRYIRSTFLPESEECFCLFEAPDAAAVQRIQEVTGLPFTEIRPALDLTP